MSKLSKRSAPAWSILLWIAAAIGAGVLWLRLEPQKGPVPAVVETIRYQIGPVTTARLTTVQVRPGDTVRAGQAVATLDTAAIDDALLIARARHEELLAEVQAEAQTFTRTLAEQRLTVATQLAQARANGADAKGKQAARKAELKTLGSRLDRLDGALADGLLEVDRLAELRARQAGLAKQARYGPASVSAWNALAQQVDGALDGIGDQALADQLAPLRKRVETQSRQIEALLAQRARNVLRAPADGQVSAVLQHPGDPLAAGTPVIEIIAERSNRLVAYAPEQSIRALSVGTLVEAEALDRTTNVAVRGVVERLGPAVVELPRRLWPEANHPAYGRAIHVRLTGDTLLLPGEAARLKPVVGALAIPITPGPSVALVPQKLAVQSRLEPSGALWLPERKRFLVISDDTGFEDFNEHIPWVFTADQEGRFDADPWLLSGAKKTSDLESITRSPDGTLYFLSSQSMSRKGKRKGKRQRLIQARLDGPDLVVTGQTNLYSAIIDGLPNAITMGATDDLDIEGMTWFQGGLLLGLKAPLDANGHAQLWHLTGVDRLFDHGFGPKGAKLVPFKTLNLPIGDQHGGISDLLYEPGTLYVLSTLARGPARGAAWRFTLPLGTSPPVQLGAWDLKPEAIARTPDKKLMIFFDTGSEPPRWVVLD